MGEELVGLIGEPDKPEVEKNLDDVDATWTAAQSAWASRQAALDEALRRATNFQDELIRMLEWLQRRGEELAGLGPIGGYRRGRSWRGWSPSASKTGGNRGWGPISQCRRGW